MPRGYCNERKPDNYVTYGGNSNLCILNKFCYKTSQGLLLMKTKNISDVDIYHTGKKRPTVQTTYHLIYLQIHPTMPIIVKKQFRHQLSLHWERTNMPLASLKTSQTYF